MRLKNKISKLIDVIKDTDINEIEISSFWGAQKIKLRKSIENNESQSKNISKEKNIQNIDIPNSNVDENNNSSGIAEDTSEKITAPLVGTFYESLKPGEPALINVGDTIEKGQSLCIIEAMKIFNTIEADFSGKITEILVNDGQPVEFGQPLFKFIKK
jgi:acetyl-CoA carboxylase biotin carboxyl carrier protein